MSFSPRFNSRPPSSLRRQTSKILDATLESIQKENDNLLKENYILRNHLLAVKENATYRVANVVSHLLQWIDKDTASVITTGLKIVNGNDSSVPASVALDDLMLSNATRNGKTDQTANYNDFQAKNNPTPGTPQHSSTPVKAKRVAQTYETQETEILRSEKFKGGYETENTIIKSGFVPIPISHMHSDSPEENTLNNSETFGQRNLVLNDLKNSTMGQSIPGQASHGFAVVHQGRGPTDDIEGTKPKEIYQNAYSPKGQTTRPIVPRPRDVMTYPTPDENFNMTQRRNDASAFLQTPPRFNHTMISPAPNPENTHGHVWENQSNTKGERRPRVEFTSASPYRDNTQREDDEEIAYFSQKTSNGETTNSGYMADVSTTSKNNRPLPVGKTQRSKYEKTDHQMSPAQKQKLKLKPTTRLIGEIAFELDRLILQYVFMSRSGSNRKRLYGYMVRNIPAKILEESYDHETRRVDEEKRYVLEYRFQYVLNSLMPYGYNFLRHPEFCIDMVNKYGLMPPTADEGSFNGLMPSDKEMVKEAVVRLAAPNERQDMLILIDCLAQLAHDAGQPMILI